MPTIENIRTEALALSIPERAELARDLLLSLEGDECEEELDADLMEELQIRLDLVALGNYVASDWQESLERVRKLLHQERQS